MPDINLADGGQLFEGTKY